MRITTRVVKAYLDAYCKVDESDREVSMHVKCCDVIPGDLCDAGRCPFEECCGAMRFMTNDELAEVMFDYVSEQVGK